MSKTNELLGKLGKQMRDFPQISTFAGAKQAEQAIAQSETTIPFEAVAVPEVKEVSLSKSVPAPEAEPSRNLEERNNRKTGAKSVRNFSVTLHQSDIDKMQEMRFLIMKESGKPTVSISETLRIAVRAFRSSKPLAEIIQEVEELDGRGMWRGSR